MSDEAAPNFTRRCFGCGLTVTHRNGKQSRHFCRLHWLARLRWSSYLEGWHAAHRFAVENLDDDMILADAHDYGSGWAGFMRQGRNEGGLRIAL